MGGMTLVIYFAIIYDIIAINLHFHKKINYPRFFLFFGTNVDYHSIKFLFHSSFYRKPAFFAVKVFTSYENFCEVFSIGQSFHTCYIIKPNAASCRKVALFTYTHI